MLDKLIKESKTIERTGVIKDVYTYCINYITKFGIGVHTTCGYIIIENKDEDIRAYFISIGLTLCFQLKSGLYHNFRGDCFTHMTSVPIKVVGEQVLYSDKNSFVLAWGSGGPHK